MVRLEALLILVFVFAAVLGSDLDVPSVQSPGCIDTNLNTTNPWVPKTKWIRMCGSVQASILIGVCRDRGGINAAIKSELKQLEKGIHGLTRCRYPPEDKALSVVCDCCVYGPCEVAKLFDYCACVTIQPPNTSPFWVADP